MSLFPSAIFCAEDVLAAPDQVQWQFDDPGRIVTVGDLHGDFNKFVDILLTAGLIDASGKWIGGAAHLVQLGDINGKGEDTRLIMDLIINIEGQARAAGGRVHTLLGNHDLKVVWGDSESTTEQEVKGFKDFAETKPADRTETAAMKRERLQRGFLAALRGDSSYAKWIRSRNMVVKIGTRLFSHGGFRKWISRVDIGAYNATARAWLAYYQGAGPKPPKGSNWVVFSDLSSAWDRKLLDLDLKREALDKIRQRLGVEEIFLGHKPSPISSESDRREVLEIYEKVYMCDTGISDRRDGTGSAVIVEGERITVLNDVAKHPDRKSVRDSVKFLGRLRGPGCALYGQYVFGG